MTSIEEVVNSPILPSGRGELLLELLSEEIPARMQRRAIEDLTGLVRAKLAAAEIPAASLEGYVTPRRLAIVADGIPPTQPDRTEERRGPRLGAPPQAIEGFLRSAGLASIEECEIRDTGRGEFYFAVVKRPGRPAAQVLPDLVKSAITELAWPKSMRWPGSPLRWVRPLSSVLCLHEGEVLPLALDGVSVGRTTRGHRFLAPSEICVTDAAEYVERLGQAYVILDQDRRRELIRADLDRCAAELGVTVKPDPGLLDEVTGLVEFPVVLAGAIDPDFMTLPPEVLQTAMRMHQKYFSCLDPDGRAAPHFLFVANNLADDGGAAIIAGNERVLRARLADARFFWDQDRKIRLEDRVEALKDRVYHAQLGSVFEKIERMSHLADFLVQRVEGADQETAYRAVRLAKADLSAGMVGEFPELQGIMGQYYALGDGEDASVAVAIADHYKPLGPADLVPVAPTTVVVALADKIDTLVTFFALGETPTGSRDPYALRRAALGVTRIILKNQIRLLLKDTFQTALEIFYCQRQVSNWEQRVPSVYAELMTFMVDRLKVHLRDQNVRHDLIAAGFAQIGTAESDLVRLLARVAALQIFVDTDDGANLLIGYRRASNIVAIEERRDGCRYEGEADASLLVQPEERVLVEALSAVGAMAEAMLAGEQFEDAMAALSKLRQPIDEFFAKVTVNTEDADLRRIRLRLLARIRDTMNRVADFSQIEG